MLEIAKTWAVHNDLDWMPAGPQLEWPTCGYRQLRIIIFDEKAQDLKDASARYTEGIAKLLAMIEGCAESAGPWARARDLPETPLPCRSCAGKGKAYAVEDCADCDGEGDFRHGQHTYECQECDGEGQVVEPSSHSDHDCDVCNGTGQDRNVASAFRDDVERMALSELYLLRLKDLDAQIRFTSSYRYIEFRFDGGRGVVMPMRTAAVRPTPAA